MISWAPYLDFLIWVSLFGYFAPRINVSAKWCHISSPAALEGGLSCTRRTVDPAGSCFARTLPRGHKLRGKQVPQAGFELWLTHMVRTHPTTTNPILVRPPSAPNGLTRRGITSKNTFLDVSKDAIAGGLSLSHVPWMEMLVFAAMVALYGGLPVTFTRVTRLVLLPIMYSIHGHPSAHNHWVAALFQGIRHRHPQKWWDTWKDTVLNKSCLAYLSKFFSMKIK